ncbi:uncharacterized protein LOC134655984 [Cydia amplana]|uniref:uncharacterized protein LOC134655984 n=1 Tax=Cydia amplana TaxID=1869771 RepID=UPI002FE557F1
MNPKHLLEIFLVLQLAFNVLAFINEYFYEFGNKEVGKQIYTKDGLIHLFEHNNYVNVPVPPNTEVTYVSVRVNAINPPKVDFDNESKSLSIKYSFLELPISSYSLYVKGKPTAG